MSVDSKAQSYHILRRTFPLFVIFHFAGTSCLTSDLGNL